ncbi:MAG: tetratricopeptide repeat protein [Phycisphaerales bacterium JB043]
MPASSPVPHACNRVLVALAWTCLGLTGSCASPLDDSRTLSGEPLPRASFDDDTSARLLENLERARAEYERTPTSEDAIIWYGRRLAYLGRYQEAIDVYTEGLAHHPSSYRLLRHRGHRYISVRRLDMAIEDLEHAAVLISGTTPRIEQDGIPNSRNSPISTTQGNIWYHLGLARYLWGDFEGALRAYDQRFLETDANDDNHCSTAYWRYLILRRLGRDDAALEAIEHITSSMDIIENFGYRDLCLLYKGELTPREVLGADNDTALALDVENATLAYGISMRTFLDGDTEEARQMWEAIVASEGGGYAFGYIAAEAELARLPE